MASKVSNIQRRLAAKASGQPYPPHPNYFQQPKARAPKEPIEKVSLVGPRKNVLFMSRSSARDFPYTKDDALISISDTNEAMPSFTHTPGEILDLHFHDEVYTKAEHDMGWRRPQRADATAIAQFLLKHTDKTNIIVHCRYGEQRSKAVALAIAECADRRVLKVMDSGSVVAYKKDHNDVGNQRLFELVFDACLSHSEEEA